MRAIGDVIALCPPFIVTSADVDEIFAKLRRGLDDTLAWAQRERLRRAADERVARRAARRDRRQRAGLGAAGRLRRSAAGERFASR